MNIEFEPGIPFSVVHDAGRGNQVDAWQASQAETDGQQTDNFKTLYFFGKN